MAVNTRRLRHRAPGHVGDLQGPPEQLGPVWERVSAFFDPGAQQRHDDLLSFVHRGLEGRALAAVAPHNQSDIPRTVTGQGRTVWPSDVRVSSKHLWS
jgi:hypothetical protein